jgi:molecular chaperone GrpE
MSEKSEFEIQIDEDPDEIRIEIIEDGADQALIEDVGADPGAGDPIVEDEDDSTGPLELQKIEHQKEIAHLREMYLRKLAEFDNFRKRTERERAEREKVAGLEVVQDLIPVIDNFERALEHASASSREALEQGIDMISKQLIDVLGRRGLEVFDPTGEVFDPEAHEAIQRVEDSNLAPGTVAWVVGKGIRFGGRLLRPAMVGVVAGSSERATIPVAEEGNGS